MPRAKLSESVIEEIQFLPKGNSFQVHWDEGLPGFGLRVYESGAKSFIVKYRIQGRQFVDSLGPFGLISLEQARESARRTLIRAYNDRVGVPDNERLIAEVCNEYIVRFARENVPDCVAEENLCTLYLKPTWGDRPVSSLRKAEVVALLDTVSGISVELANGLKLLISRIWECATSWGYIDEAIKNPTLGISDVLPQPEACSPGSEVERIFSALAAEPNYFARAAVLVLLFSSLHKEEVIQAKWEQIDWHSKTISVERWGNKRKRLFVMPLSEPALTILEAMPKHPGNPFVFCGKERCKPIDNFDDRWERIRALAGIKQTKLQTLRSAFAELFLGDELICQRAMKVLGYRC